MPLTWPRIQSLGSCLGHFASTENPAASVPVPGESPLDPEGALRAVAQAAIARAQPSIECRGMGSSGGSGAPRLYVSALRKAIRWDGAKPDRSRNQSVANPEKSARPA